MRTLQTMIPLNGALRRLASWTLLLSVCLVDSPCDVSSGLGSGCRDRHVAAANNTSQECHRDECRVLSQLEFQGKRACAIPPVDFRRVSGQQSLAAASPAPLPAGTTTFTLHSRPSATKVIYLDFDGHVTRDTPWSNTPITTTAYDMDSNPESFSTSEQANILEIWQRVAECYSPFDVDVTTEAPAVSDLIDTGNGDTRWGIRVLFGDSSPSPAPGSGGVAYLFSFGWNTGSGTDVPCFVLQDGVGTLPKYNADAAVHEVGHTLGLDHDGQYPSSDSRHVEYYEGHGSGKVGWAPQMGAAYYRPLVQWSRGEYANASTTEDDLNIITANNGFGFRPDDYPGMASTSVPIPGSPNATTFNVNVSGVISTRTDFDWFKINAAAGPIQLNAVGGPGVSMLDIQLTLYNSSAVIVATSNPADDIIASISQSVAAGTYYLKIDGVGLDSPLTTGYTDYSSLGQYTITGSYTLPSTVQDGSSPVLTGANNQYYGVKQGAKNVNLGITVTDPDSTTLASATVTITNVVPNQDLLTVSLDSQRTGNIASNYNSSTGTLTLTSAGATATVAQFQAALRAVAYTNSSASPSFTPRQVEFHVTDGANSSNTLTTVITIGYFYVRTTYDAASNTLTLVDDVGDNAVTIAYSSGKLVVSGAGPTRIGTLASSQPSVSFPYTTDVKVNCNFGGGSDTITMNSLRSSTATFNMGNGNDRVTLNYCNITSSLAVDGGSGVDTVTLFGSVIRASQYTAVP